MNSKYIDILVLGVLIWLIIFGIGFFFSITPDLIPYIGIITQPLIYLYFLNYKKLNGIFTTGVIWILMSIIFDAIYVFILNPTINPRYFYLWHVWARYALTLIGVFVFSKYKKI